MSKTLVTPQWSPMPFSFIRPGEVLALGIALPLVCAFISILRIYTRRLQRQELKVDDWLIIPCTVRALFKKGDIKSLRPLTGSSLRHGGGIDHRLCAWSYGVSNPTTIWHESSINLHHFFALTAFGTDRIFFPAFAVPFYGHNQT
jgi:hypothetical protein